MYVVVAVFALAPKAACVLAACPLIGMRLLCLNFSVGACEGSYGHFVTFKMSDLVIQNYAFTLLLQNDKRKSEVEKLSLYQWHWTKSEKVSKSI